ncbi:MAG: Ig-like domain-containing protein [Bacteroidota bacterium]
MKVIFLVCLFLSIFLGITSCNGNKDEVKPIITILSSTINGYNTSGSHVDIPVNISIELVFSSSINPAAFESFFSITSDGTNASYSLSYSNATSKVTITGILEYNKTYKVSLDTELIGGKGEKLSTPLNFSFKTAEDNIIRYASPCVTLGSCLRSVEMEGTQGKGTFEFYSNYPIYEVNARWENLTQAILVVHGASHNPDDYYTYLTNTLEGESLSTSTVLISPFFRNISTGFSEDFYWENTDWRRGEQSSNTNKISSFEVMDLLIEKLSDKELFPVLNKIIITGHSSGAAFTHVYAGADKAESVHSEISFEYIIANSQFFYYPNGQRINELSNELYTPEGCLSYDIWPLGYNSIPLYLSGVTSSDFNSQFVNRSIWYLLGNGNQSDPTLNITDCENTLQGSTRYKRGENMFRYMELVYPSIHNHSKTIVNGIGHDGSGMYQSSEFKTLLNKLIK